MQEDKEPMFDAFDSLALSIAADDRHGRRHDAERQRDARRPRAPATATATDLADWLVRTLGIPFREAHELTGRIVAAAEAKGVGPGKAAAGRHAGRRTAHHHRGLFRCSARANR